MFPSQDDPDNLPGQGPAERSLIRRTFESLTAARGNRGKLTKEDIFHLLQDSGFGGSSSSSSGGGGGGEAGGDAGGAATVTAESLASQQALQETVDTLWGELGLALQADVDLPTW
jgi:hypothetical protein